MNASPSPLQIAKERLRIPQLWKLREWPGKPGKSCCFPDGADRKPSASVFRDGFLLRDFRSAQTYDAPALLAAVESLTPEAACRLFIALAGVSRDDITAARHAPKTTLAVRNESAAARVKPRLPSLARGSEADLRALATLRGVSMEAVRLADARGLLWFADSAHDRSRAWIVTDRERWNAIARRLDGEPWRCLPSHPKARTLRGAWASWPIGLAEAVDFPAIAFTEGAPDLLAAFHFASAQGMAERIAPVCMAGAGLRIPAECLHSFAGRRVRVFVHDDDAGRAAFARWTGQIEGAGGTVDGFDFSGLLRDDASPVADLNDLCRIGEESRAQWGALVDACMDFAPHEQASRNAAALLAPSERETLKRAGCENDPLILRAIEIFNARVAPLED